MLRKTQLTLAVLAAVALVVTFVLGYVAIAIPGSNGRLVEAAALTIALCAVLAFMAGTFWLTEDL